VRRKYHPTDFSDGQWQRLLAYALERADAFECVLPYRVVLQNLECAPLWPAELDEHREAIVDRYVSLIRWELRRDEPTQFVRFRLTTALRSYIQGADRLEDWCWRSGRPEDPSFFRGGEPVLVTESIDGRIAVYADPDEVQGLGSRGVRLLEPLGVRAEPWPTP